METLTCPLCKKELSNTGTTIPGPGEVAESVSIETLYCASCEMLVAPVASSAPRVTLNASDRRLKLASLGWAFHPDSMVQI
jgi:hypothetical protein